MGAAERALAARQQQRRRCLLLDAQLRPQEAGQQVEKRQRAQPGEPDKEAQPEPLCPLPPTRLQRQCAAVLHRRYPTATLLAGCVPGRPAPPPLAQPERWAWRKAFPWPPPPPRPQQQPEPAFVPGTPPESGRSTPTYFRKSPRAAQVDPLFGDSDASSVTYSDRFDPDSDDEPQQAQHADDGVLVSTAAPPPAAASASAPGADEKEDDRTKSALETLAALAAVQPRLSYDTSAAAAWRSIGLRAAARAEEGMLADACAPGPGGGRGPHPGSDRPPHAAGLELLERYKLAAFRGLDDLHCARNQPGAAPLGHLIVGACGRAAAALLERALERLRPGLLQAQAASWGRLVAMARAGGPDFSALRVLHAATKGVEMLEGSSVGDEDVDVQLCAALSAAYDIYMAGFLPGAQGTGGAPCAGPWAPAQIYDIMLYGMDPPAALWQGGGAGPASTGGPRPPPPYKRLSMSYLLRVCRVLADGARAACMLARAALTKQLLGQRPHGAREAAPLELSHDHPALRDLSAALGLLLAQGLGSADEPGLRYNQPYGYPAGLYDTLFLPWLPVPDAAARLVEGRLTRLAAHNLLSVRVRGEAEVAELRAALRRTAGAAADLAGWTRHDWLWAALRHCMANRGYARFRRRVAALEMRARLDSAAREVLARALWGRAGTPASLCDAAECLQPGLMAAHWDTWAVLLKELDMGWGDPKQRRELCEIAEAALLGLSAVTILELPPDMLHLSYCTIVGTYMRARLDEEGEYRDDYYTNAARVAPTFLQLLFIPLPFEALQPEPGWTSAPPPPPPPPLPLPQSTPGYGWKLQEQEAIRASLLDSLARQNPRDYLDTSWQAALAEHMMLACVRQQALEAQGRARHRRGASGEAAVDAECTLMAYEVAVHALVELGGEAGSRSGSPARSRGEGGAGRGEGGGGTPPGGGRSSGHVSESDVDEGGAREREPARGAGAAVDDVPRNAAGVPILRLSSAEGGPKGLVDFLVWLAKQAMDSCAPLDWQRGQQQPHRQQQQQPGQQQPGQQQPRPLAELVLVGAEYMSFVLLVLDRFHVPVEGYGPNMVLLVQPCCSPELAAIPPGVQGQGQEVAALPPARGAPGVIQLSAWPGRAPSRLGETAYDWQRCYKWGRTVSAHTKLGDVRRLVRKALVEERHCIFQLVGKGVEGVHRALVLAAQARQDLQAAGRDLFVCVRDSNLQELQREEDNEQRQLHYQRAKREPQPAGGGAHGGGTNGGGGGGALNPGGLGAAGHVHDVAMRLLLYMRAYGNGDDPRLPRVPRAPRMRRLIREMHEMLPDVHQALEELRHAGGSGVGGVAGLEVALLLVECEPGRPDRAVVPERVAPTVGLQRLQRLRVQKKMLEG